MRGSRFQNEPNVKCKDTHHTVYWNHSGNLILCGLPVSNVFGLDTGFVYTIYTTNTWHSNFMWTLHVIFATTSSHHAAFERIMTLHTDRNTVVTLALSSQRIKLPLWFQYTVWCVSLHLRFGSIWNRDPRTQTNRSRRLLGVRGSYADPTSGQTPTWRSVNSFGMHSSTRKKYWFCYWPFFWISTVVDNESQKQIWRDRQWSL